MGPLPLHPQLSPIHPKLAVAEMQRVVELPSSRRRPPPRPPPSPSTTNVGAASSASNRSGVAFKVEFSQSFHQNIPAANNQSPAKVTWQALNSACDTLEPGLAKRILPDKDRQGTDSFKDGWSLLALSGLNGPVAQDVWNLVDVAGTLLLASSSSENGVPAVHLVKAFIKTSTGSRHACLCSHVFKAKLLALVAEVDASFFDAQRSRTHQKVNGLSKDGIRWLRDKGFTDLPLPDPDALTHE